MRCRHVIARGGGVGVAIKRADGGGAVAAAGGAWARGRDSSVGEEEEARAVVFASRR